MRIVVITSSSADYGIYRPLLREFKKDAYFDLKLIVFGTHLSSKHGNTINQIESDGFKIDHRIETLPEGDNPIDISKSMGDTIKHFAPLWLELKDKIDLIFCLGDRYEMFAAVASSVPFLIPVAHLHGGETTSGAIDDRFRHAITHMSDVHFASTEKHVQRIVQLKGSEKNVYNVGALSLDNLKDVKLSNAKDFQKKFAIPVKSPVLVTFHPETVAYEKNGEYVLELIKALSALDDQIIITMPNADTRSNVIRDRLSEFAKKNSNVYAIESFGTEGYFSCMNLCRFMLGNSSSGIIEAASFGKYVINLGHRQHGREAGKNVINCEIKARKILEAIKKVKSAPTLDKSNVYGNGHSSEKIIKALKGITLHTNTP